MLAYIFLTEEFYNNYPRKFYPEIEHKPDRPYILIHIKIDNYDFALPLRSHIKHKFAFITDKENSCGIDFTKAVYIKDKKYIDNDRVPHIIE